jgi:tRNA (guanosine-2'-O-)-methyltransferase
MTEGRAQLIEKVASVRTRHLIVALEDIQKDHNSAAIIRNCDCFGIQEMHVMDYQKTPKVQAAIAKGAENWVDVVYHTGTENNVLHAVQELKTKGYRIVATSPHQGGYTPETLPINQPIALFFGNELEGISNEVIRLADDFLELPMYGFTESFNVSVSVALILHTLRQRLESSEIEFLLAEEDRINLLFQWAQYSVQGSSRILENFEREPEKYVQHL